jgi:GNAT superfamily N-acetyltransferase
LSVPALSPVELLDPGRHDTAGFSSGVEVLDDWLHRVAPVAAAASTAAPALDRQEQGTGLGGDLLLDALIRSVAGARQYGARALVVDAIDDRAVEFYRHHGFLPLEGRRLYRRTSDIERALRG